MFEPTISSTNTSLSAQSSAETITRQAALQELVALGGERGPFFRLWPSLLTSRLTVDSLMGSPVSYAPGSAASLRRSPPGDRRGPPKAASSGGIAALGGSLPGGFLGASESPWRSILAKRFTEERLTPKRPAASLLGMPRFRASTISCV